MSWLFVLKKTYENESVHTNNTAGQCVDFDIERRDSPRMEHISCSDEKTDVCTGRERQSESHTMIYFNLIYSPPINFSTDNHSMDHILWWYHIALECVIHRNLSTIEILLRSDVVGSTDIFKCRFLNCWRCHI